ncbi:unnamed protein product [Calicophoron daubneyi]
MSPLETHTCDGVGAAPRSRSSVSSGSGSDQPLTPDSNDTASSPELPAFVNLPPGCFNDPTNDIYEGNPEEMNGTMLPKVLIPSDLWAEAVDKDIWRETFCIPAHMGGVLIGRLGKNVKELRNIWQAGFSLNTCPGRQDTLIFKLSCPVKHKDDVLQWVSRRLRMRPSRTPIGNPNQLKRYLPLGESVPVYVRSLYASKEFFITIKDEEYTKYLRMQAELDEDYAAAATFRMQLCEPVTSGTVAVVPHSQGFARALIISVYPTWPKTVFYFLLDHGTFGVVALTKLRKIRAKYMRTSFQAIHVSWAHAFPVFSDIPDIHVLRTYFSSGQTQAFAVRMETCCRASVAFGEPYPQPYSTNGLLDTLVSACNSGLYMAIPVALYPSRQCWLNGTNIPYYPFTYSAIDYSALVSFIPDEASSMDGRSVLDCQPVLNHRNRSGHENQPRQTVQGKGRPSRGGVGAPVRRPFVWHQRHMGGGRNGNPKPLSASQKENQNSSVVPEKDPSKSPEQSCNTEPRRKPLLSRNSRGSGFRGSYSRGRGYSNTRPRE